MTDKETLRRQSIKRRAGFSILEIAELSARVSMNVLAMPQMSQARHVFCYFGVKNEVSTHGLIRELLELGREVYLPKMGEADQIEAVRLRGKDELVPGRFDILEPRGDERIDPALLDLLLIPGLAFDRRGGRLGYGKGYFDRFLPRCAGLFVGLAYEAQIVDAVPLEPHDVRMRVVVTERAIYDCGLEE